MMVEERVEPPPLVLGDPIVVILLANSEGEVLGS
jgi:hypothetical protein